MLSESLKRKIRAAYGSLSQSVPGFTKRPQQNQLIAEISKVLAGHYDRQRRILLAEAGTGTGKSLAYLLAAIPLAQAFNKKLIISTATVALQEQLVEKDLPLLARHSGLEFRFLLAKGRQRYCCEHKLEEVLGQADQPLLSQEFAPLATEQRAQLQALRQAYLEGRWQGDRDSWPEPVDEGLWQRIAADRHSCHSALKHHQHCPFQRARRELEQADVLVVNHSLLLADLDAGGAVLAAPSDCFYVLDEAHHLPHHAREMATASISVRASLTWLGRIDDYGRRLSQLLDSERSIGPRLALLDHTQTLLKRLNGLNHYLQTARFSWQEQQYRFAMGELPEPMALQAVELRDESKQLLQQLNRLEGLILEAIKDSPVRTRAKREALLAETGMLLQRTEGFWQLWWLLTRPRTARQAPCAAWLEQLAGKPADFRLTACPLDVAGKLNQQLWSEAAGVVLCSATLTALGRFDYYCREVGLRRDDGSRFLRVPSPFDYSQVELRLPKMDYQPSQEPFTAELIRRLPTLLREQSSTLVLFSSYWQMQAVADGLRSDVPLLVQGEASRSSLLTRHKQRCDSGQPSILFGTGSFSEGLDLPGRYLTNLIITKLPFAVPTSPLEQAMAEWVEAQGGNPFLQLTVPLASRKLVQACGRLVRSEQDRGRIVILDRRLVTRRYGAALLEALPPFRRLIEP